MSGGPQEMGELRFAAFQKLDHTAARGICELALSPCLVLTLLCRWYNRVVSSAGSLSGEQPV